MPRIKLDANCIIASVYGGYIVERLWWQCGESGELERHSRLHSCASLEGALDIMRRHIAWIESEMALGFEISENESAPPPFKSIADGG